MHVDPTSKIAGLPVLRLRSYFRRVGEAEWPIEKLAEEFSLELSAATAIARDLVRMGLAEDSARTGKLGCYRVTSAGRRLALASAVRALTRQSADRVLERFLERVQTVNADAYYLYRVRQVQVFGSYLTRLERVNAIDVAVDLIPRHLNPERHAAQMQKRVEEARNMGRKFGDIAQELMWSRKEVMLFLKAQSRAITLHEIREVLKNAKTKTIFDAAAR